MAVKVKLFDEEHELDLEEKVNAFLSNINRNNLIDIKYQVATMYDYKTQIYCYSAMVIYKEEDE